MPVLFLLHKGAKMAARRILPLGFIDRTTDDGAIIMLTRPSESRDIQYDTPVTLRVRSTGATRATARVRGVITSVGYLTATFKTVETRKTTNWPQDQPVLQRGLPVYQALPESFNPDPARTLSKEQSESLSRIAARYQAIVKPTRSRAISRRQLRSNGSTPGS